MRRSHQQRIAFTLVELLVVIAIIGVLVGLFYMLWGYNYALPPRPERLGWLSLNDVGAEELTELVVETAVATNAAYLTLHGTPDAGTPTPLPDDHDALEDALQIGWRNAR